MQSETGSPRLKVVVLCDSSQYSGAEVVLERIVARAIRRDWEIVALVPDGESRVHLASAGAVVVSVPQLRVPSGPRILTAATWTLRSFRAARLLRKEASDCDLVIVNGALCLLALRMARVRPPKIWVVHDVITRRDRLALVRMTRSAGHSAVAVSEAAAGPARRLGLSVVVIPNGTPIPAVRGPDFPQDPKVVGCVAALTSWKGQDVLLDAIARIDPEVQLDLAGQAFPRDAGYEKRLRARAGKRDLSGRVRFLGFRDDVLELMRSWTVAVSSSVEPEAVGLATLEAMSLGIPVVGTDIGATPAIVGGAGLLVAPGDAAAMAGAIGRLLNDTELWQRCHLAGPARVKAHFDGERQLDSMLSHLEEVARSHAAARD